MSKKILSLLSAAMLAGSFTALAVPAKPGLMRYTQPDGTVVTVRLVGDERAHYYLTEDNYPLIATPNGELRYAEIGQNGLPVASELKARDIKERSSADRDLMNRVDASALTGQIRTLSCQNSRMNAAPQQGMGLFTTSFPSTGDIKSIVILVEYTDVKFTIPNPNEYFTALLNEEGFSLDGGTGSAREFYEDASMNKFRPEFDVYGPVTLPNSMSYYGGNTYSWWGTGDDQNPELMLVHAADILDPEVDFSQYDADGDGVVDNVYIFYAGMGEASGGPTDSVWPHSWELSHAGVTKTCDGVKLDRYACSNEWEGGSWSSANKKPIGGKPDGIGTFCHEFGHVLGLPDLYATGYEHDDTPGDWDLMDHGSYNGDSRTPPTLSAYERNALGWLDLQVLDGPASITLEHILTSNVGYLIPTSKDTEFFLLENRQQSGWDSTLPGHGMLVWHIDFVQSVWDSNRVNNNSSHQYVDLVEANRSTTSRAGNAFPGPSGSYTSFTSTTNPALKTWGGTAINLPLTNITESDGLITLDVAGGLQHIDDVVSASAVSSTPYSVSLEWDAVEGARQYVLSVWSVDEPMPTATDTDTREYLPGYEAKVINGTSHTIEGLQPATNYAYAVRAKAGNVLSDNEYTDLFATAELTFDYMRPEALAADGITATAFNANWLPLDDAVDYLLSVSAVTLSGSNDEVCNMGNTTLYLPDGWLTNSTDYYDSSQYIGKAAPSLKMKAEGQYLTTPCYADPLKGITFWYRGASCADTNSLDVQMRAGDTDAWTTVYTVQPIGTSAKTITVDAPDQNMHQARLVYHKVGNGNLAIDDVVASVLTMAVSPVEGIQDLSVGNVTSYRVEAADVAPGAKDFFYTVQAVNADGIKSLVSNKISTALNGNSGVGSVSVSEASRIRVDGRTVSYTGRPGAVVRVIDGSGRIVAATRADGAGSATLTVAGSGFYVVVADDCTAKAALR